MRLQGRLQVFTDPVAALQTFQAGSAAAARARDPELEVGTWLGIANALSAQKRYKESQWALKAAEGGGPADQLGGTLAVGVGARASGGRGGGRGEMEAGPGRSGEKPRFRPRDRGPRPR